MKGTLLVVDVGNTHIVLGVYDGEKLLAHWRLDTRQKRTEDEMAVILNQLFAMRGLSLASIKDVAVSCVAPRIMPMITAFCQSAFGCKPLVVGPGVKTGVVINVDNPKEVGADRIANVAGALTSDKPPMILVDFGTAITIDAVSKKGEYLGGAIIPGVHLSLNALRQKAARLPEITFSEPSGVIGRNTVHSMQSGAFYGYACMVDGMVARMIKELGGASTVIATGGEAKLVAPASSTITRVREHLTLEGLKAIYEKNR